MDYKTKGVCSREINFEVEDNKVKNVQFVGGCSGNTQGVAKLCEGMDVNEVIDRLEGIRCGMKPTSCPDQLAQALKAVRGADFIYTDVWYGLYENEMPKEERVRVFADCLLYTSPSPRDS